MLELAMGLSPAQLDAVAKLETRVVRHDGGRLKLEWGVLRSRSPEGVSDILWWDDDRLLGFLGIYQFGSSALELTGMVDPEARRQGIGSTLLDAGLSQLRERGCDRLLLVVPRASTGGVGLAVAYGMQLDHSEHALILKTCPPVGDQRPDISLRQVTAGDLPELSRLFLDGFGSGDIDPARALSSERTRTLVVMAREGVVGTISLGHDRSCAGVYGFVIDSAHRGRGIGTEVLSRSCRQLFEDGAETVNLEVAVENERALGLYRRLGFEPITTEDYYALEL